MKKLWISLLSLLLIFSIVRCGSNPASQPTEGSTEKEPSQAMTEEPSSEQPESSEAAEPEENENTILIAYFSRWGNTDYPKDVDATTSASIVADGENYGTTEYVARLIRNQVGGDFYLIQTQDKYTADFDELRDVNHNEIAERYLPPLTESSLDISRYDTVFIGYPVWATEVPQAVLSFLNEYDLSGKTVIPFCTHDGYGAGRSYSTIQEASHGLQSPEGLAIEAKDVPTAKDTVDAWLGLTHGLRRSGLQEKAQEREIPKQLLQLPLAIPFLTE